MAGFYEVSCVKYCVLAVPRGHLTVQTPVGIKRALRYPRPRRGTRRGSYIGASVASDVAIAIALFSQYIKEWWWTDFCWVGGRHARVLFIFASPCFSLSLGCTWSPCLSLSLSCTWSPVFLFAFVVALAYPYPRLFLVYLAFPLCLVHSIHITRKHALHIYALFIHLAA